MRLLPISIILFTTAVLPFGGYKRNSKAQEATKHVNVTEQFDNPYFQQMVRDFPTIIKISEEDKSTLPNDISIMKKVRNLILNKRSMSKAMNEEDVRYYQRYAGAAYCEPKSISQWSCGHCKKIGAKEDLEMFSLFYNEEKNNQGYMLVNNKIKKIIITFRGTVESSFTNWLTNIDVISLVKPTGLSANIDRPGVLVHPGFNKAKERMAKFYNPTVKEMYDKYKYDIIVTGHSLGGAIASLVAADLLNSGIPKDKINLITYCQPRVGNKKFAEWMNTNIHSSTRVTHEGDPVSLLPPKKYCSLKKDGWCAHQSTEVYVSKEGKIKICTAGLYEDKECTYSGGKGMSVSEAVAAHSKLLGIKFGGGCKEGEE